MPRIVSDQQFSGGSDHYHAALSFAQAAHEYSVKHIEDPSPFSAVPALSLWHQANYHALYSALRLSGRSVDVLTALQQPEGKIELLTKAALFRIPILCDAELIARFQLVTARGNAVVSMQLDSYVLEDIRIMERMYHVIMDFIKVHYLEQV